MSPTSFLNTRATLRTGGDHKETPPISKSSDHVRIIVWKSEWSATTHIMRQRLLAMTKLANDSGVMIVGLAAWVAHPPPVGKWAWKREDEVDFVFPHEGLVSLREVSLAERRIRYSQVVSITQLFVEEAEAASSIKVTNMKLAAERLVRALS